MATREQMEQTSHDLAIEQRASQRARAAALEEAAKVCLVKVKRQPGYQGQWEGYGSLDDWMTGPECAAAIRAMKEET